MTTIWQSLPVGAGGQLSGVAVANDGTMATFTDTMGAYLYSPSALDARGVAGVFQPLCTTSRLPSDAWSTPLSNNASWALAFAPTNSSVIYMHYGQFPGPGVTGTASRIYVSTNKGVSFVRCGTFEQVTGSVAPNRFAGPKMAVDPANSNYVLTSTTGNGIYFTSNGLSGNSATWTQISTATIPANDANITGCVAFDSPTNPSYGTTGGITNKQYASVSGHGLYATLNAGSTWAIVTGTPTTIGQIWVGVDGTLYAADQNTAYLKRLTWSGSTPTWTDITPTSCPVQAVVCDPNNAAHVVVFNYTASGGVLFQESNNANTTATWSTANGTTPTVDTTQIPYHGDNLISLLFGALDIVWVSADPSTNPSKIYAVGPQTLLKATFPMAAAGVSQSWTDIGGGIEQMAGLGVLVPAGVPIVVGADISILNSTSRSQYAQKILWDRTHYLTVCPAIDYDAAGSSGTVVALIGGFPNGSPENSASSSDNGLTWTAFPSFPSSTNSNMGMIACASSTNWLYCRYSGQPAYTTNAGTSWNLISTPGGVAANNDGWAWAAFLDMQNRIAADRVNGNLYMQNSAANGGSFAGTYVSTNGGSTWTYHANSIDSTAVYARLKAVPLNAGNLFFSCWTGSGGNFTPATGALFSRSTNAGTSWTTVSGFYNVFAFGFGKPQQGQTYPAIGVYGYFNPGSGARLGFWVSYDNAATWAILDNGLPDAGMYPDGIPDLINDISGDMATFGTWYYSKQGSGYSMGFDAGTSTTVSNVLGLASAQY